MVGSVSAADLAERLYTKALPMLLQLMTAFLIKVVMPNQFLTLKPDASDADIALFINAALATADTKQINIAIGAAVKLFSVTEIAEMAGLQRASVHRAFAGGLKDGNFNTVIKVLRAMGFQFSIERALDSSRLPRRTRMARKSAKVDFA